MPKNPRGRRFAILSDDTTSILDVSSDGALSRADASKVSLVGSLSSGLGVGSNVGLSRFSGSGKSSNKLQSLFNPFTKATQDKTDQLSEFLSNFTLLSLPHLPDSITRGRPHFDPNFLYLEKHWTDIVDGHEKLNKRQRDQQEAIWELLSTEVEYIRKLRVIIDLFYSCLIHLQNNQLLTEIETDKVFSNICDVFYATSHFWTIHMSQVLKRGRETREPLDSGLLKSGFQVFDRIFEPYIKYCLDQERCRDYLKVKMKENELFRTFITWAEGQSQCSRLTLNDLISKPFQRITKYALLLGALKKPLQKMDHNADVEQQIKDVTKMVEQVESFVLQVNRVMKQRQEHMQLSVMMDRIDSYEAVEAPSDECSKIVEQYSKLDLTMPVPGCGLHVSRKILFEGSLKLKDTYSKMDVYCFLFTDMLLITKPTAKRGDKVKVIKPPMRLDKIIVQGMRDVASFMMMHLNEYSMAQNVYTFHGDSKVWMAHLTKAQRDYQTKRLDYHLQDTTKNIQQSIQDQSRPISISENRNQMESNFKHEHNPYQVIPRRRPSTSMERFSDDHALCRSTASYPLASYISQLSVPTFFTATSHSNSEHLRASNNELSSSYSETTSPVAKVFNKNLERRNISSDKLRRKFKLGELSTGGSLTESASKFDTETGLDSEEFQPLPSNLSTSCDTFPDINILDAMNVPDQNVHPYSSGGLPSIRLRRPSYQHRRNPSDPLEYSIAATASPSSFSGSSEFGGNSNRELNQWGNNNPLNKSLKCLSLSTDNLNCEKLPVLMNSNLSGSTSLLNQTVKPYSIDTTPARTKLGVQELGSKNLNRDASDSAAHHKIPDEGTIQEFIPPDDKLLDLTRAALESTLKKKIKTNTTSSNENKVSQCLDEMNKNIEQKMGETTDASLERGTVESPNDVKSEKKESSSASPPDEEFHLCYLPEEYFSFPPVPHPTPEHEPTSPNWRKHRQRQILAAAAEVSTQTPIGFLISGYFSVTSGTTDSDPGPRSQPSSRSLPNIFDVLPSAYLAVKYLRGRDAAMYECPPSSSLLEAS